MTKNGDAKNRDVPKNLGYRSVLPGWWFAPGGGEFLGTSLILGRE